MTNHIRRRQFITLLAAARRRCSRWRQRAQEASGMRRIGWLTGGAENDLGSRSNRTPFQEALAKLGWIEGRNLRIDLRFGTDDLFLGAAHNREADATFGKFQLANSGQTTWHGFSQLIFASLSQREHLP